MVGKELKSPLNPSTILSRVIASKSCMCCRCFIRKNVLNYADMLRSSGRRRSAHGFGFSNTFPSIREQKSHANLALFVFLKSEERTPVFCFESYKIDPPTCTELALIFHQQTGCLHDVFYFAGTLKKCDIPARACCSCRHCIAVAVGRCQGDLRSSTA